MSKKEINVYWSPGYNKTAANNVDFSMLYPDPETLHQQLLNKKNPEIKRGSFFSCPATQSFFKQIYVFKNAINYKYEYDMANDIFNPISPQSIEAKPTREPSIKDGPIAQSALTYLFFADAPLTATFMSPFFSKANYMKYGSLIPGEFDIGQWFRPFSIETQLWSNKGFLEFQEDEPLFYVRFNTNKKINFYRFEMNDKLHSYVDHCVYYYKLFGPLRPLSERYAKFKQARLADSILTEIKKNIIGDKNV